MSKPDPLHSQALRYKFIYSMAGLFLGLVSMLGGIVLFLNGVWGSTSWTAKIFGNESTITDAAPGVVLFIVGLFVIIVTKYSAKIEQDRNKDGESIVTTLRKP
ncbi:MAG: hypothetical protein WBE75_07390 [Candidatus Omnitrophota bacterium]|jgi:uncharacterized membrane protein YedE/YeeE